MLDVLKDFWSVMLAALAALVWLIRLESRSISNEREVQRIWQQRAEDMDAAKDSREATARLLDEIRIDIKALLGRSGNGADHRNRER